MPADKNSASSSELVAGFRLERKLGARTWLATQPELGRRVALRLVQPPFDSTVWPEDPGVVDLLLATATPEGVYVATRYVPGARTWAERPGSRAALDQVAATLGRVTHGDLTPRDVLIDEDGNALLTGFGRPVGGDDRDALTALRPRERRSRAWLLVPLIAAAVGGAVVVTRDEPERVPPVAEGATAYGSALAADGIETVDCAGEEPGGSSLACTIVQTNVPLTPTAGTVRAWTVRGVRGRVRLQVLVDEGDGVVSVNGTAFVRVNDPDAVHIERTSQDVPAGARFALQADPGTGVGVRTADGARLETFTGPLHDTAREPDPEPLADRELQLRVDFVADGG